MISIEQNLQHDYFLQKFNENSSCYEFDHNFINNINWFKSYLIAYKIDINSNNIIKYDK